MKTFLILFFLLIFNHTSYSQYIFKSSDFIEHTDDSLERVSFYVPNSVMGNCAQGSRDFDSFFADVGISYSISTSSYFFTDQLCKLKIEFQSKLGAMLIFKYDTNDILAEIFLFDNSSTVLLGKGSTVIHKFNEKTMEMELIEEFHNEVILFPRLIKHIDLKSNVIHDDLNYYISLQDVPWFGESKKNYLKFYPNKVQWKIKE